MKVSASQIAMRMAAPSQDATQRVELNPTNRVDGMDPQELSQSDRDKIKVAQQFEAIFVRQLLQQMQPDAASKEGGSAGGELYQGMGQEALAEHISTQSEGFGIAHSLLKHWGVKSVK